MDISQDRLTRFFGTCFLVAAGLILIWFLIYLVMGDLAYAIHSRLFDIDRAQFGAMNYFGMSLMKILAFVLFLVPYIALKIIGKGTGQST